MAKLPMSKRGGWWSYSSSESQRHAEAARLGWQRKKRTTTDAYTLGYADASAPKTSINYREKLRVPINSFSRPDIQTPQYIRGWNAGRKKMR